MKKKLLLLLSVTTLLLTGCGKKVELDLNKIEKDLQELKGDEFSFYAANDIINKKYMTYEDVYDTKDIGINYDNSETILYKKDSASGNEVFVINPIKDKKQEVIDLMKKHFEKAENLTFTEVDNYLFYINAEDSKMTIKDIEQAKGLIFSSLINIAKNDLEMQLGVKESWVEESLVMTPSIIVNSNLYIIIKPVKNHKEDVLAAVDKYMENKEDEWSTYLPDQYELMKNRKFEKYGDYLIYIVSTDNSKVLDTIKKAEK